MRREGINESVFPLLPSSSHISLPTVSILYHLCHFLSSFSSFLLLRFTLFALSPSINWVLPSCRSSLLPISCLTVRVLKMTKRIGVNDYSLSSFCILSCENVGSFASSHFRQLHCSTAVHVTVSVSLHFPFSFYISHKILRPFPSSFPSIIKFLTAKTWIPFSNTFFPSLYSFLPIFFFIYSLRFCTCSPFQNNEQSWDDEK